MTTLFWVIPLGLLVGLTLGSLGAGGSILTVPALVYLLGQPASAATSGSLIIVGITSLVGLVPHYRRGNVRVGRGLMFGVLGVVGAFVGSRLAAGVPAALLLSTFAVLMFVVALLMWQRLRRAGNTPPPDDTEPVRWVPVAVAATGVGLLTGFFGVGGGFAVVPALVLVLGMSMPVAVGTSLLVITVNSASALISRLGAGIALDWVTIGGFAAFAVVGSLLGARVAARFSQRTLTTVFIAMLLAIGAYMAIDNVPRLLA